MIIYCSVAVVVVGLVAGGIILNQKPANASAAPEQEVQAGDGLEAQVSDYIPFTNNKDARAALVEAEKLYQKGQALQGEERNRHYKKVARICKRVLRSKNVDEELKQKANKIEYWARKGESVL